MCGIDDDEAFATCASLASLNILLEALEVLTTQIAYAEIAHCCTVFAGRLKLVELLQNFSRSQGLA